MKKNPIHIADVERRIVEIIIDQLKIEDVTPLTFDVNLDLVDELGIDSMDLATVALMLKDQFEIQIDEADYPKLTTVHLIAEYLMANLQNPASAILSSEESKRTSGRGKGQPKGKSPRNLPFK